MLEARAPAVIAEFQIDQFGLVSAARKSGTAAQSRSAEHGVMEMNLRHNALLSRM
jgi:hypothetical protein